MKNQTSNIALEGICNGDVVGGVLSWTGESFRPFVFERGNHRPEKERAVQKEGNPKGQP